MANKKRALIVGCGNIGALYDYKKEGVRTHVKAFVQNHLFETFVFDQNQDLARNIASYYNIAFLNDLDRIMDKEFDVVVISTPTNTHFDYLNRFLKMNIPVIVCEKPVTDTVEKLLELQKLKEASTSKVLVNYFRRFHPSYQKLKEVIKSIDQPLTNIQITYQRGFSNNASHALDLLHLFFGENNLENVHICHCALDEFENDPTLTLTATFQSIPISIQGLQFVKHSFFELKLWFKTVMVSIENNGQSIRLLSAAANKEFSFYLPLEPIPSAFDGTNAIENAMQYLVESVLKYLENPALEDNFDSSVQLNHQSLKIIESICHN